MASGIVETSSSQGSGSATQGASRSQLVQRLLTASSNLPAFVKDLLANQLVIVAGTEAAGFVVERKESAFNLRPIAHIRPDESSDETRAAAIAAFQEILRPCILENKDGAVEIFSQDDSVEPQFCLVTLLRNEGEVVAASAIITRCRNLERAQQRLMSVQLVAGYFELYILRRSSEQAQLVAQSHQHVLQLATAVATAEGFGSATMNLCNELALRTSATRVALGWIKGQNVKVKALSHTEQFDKKQELVVQLQRAMEECADQEEPVQYDPDGGGSQNVAREAQALSRSQGGNTVLSLPLRRRDEIIGVVTLEFPADKKLTQQAATGLAVAVDLLAPQLYDRYQNDRWLITKAGLSLRESAKMAIGPRHMLAKCVVTLIAVAVIFVTFYKPMYRVTAPFQFTPIEKRLISPPFEGFIGKVHVKAGDTVNKGDILLEMNKTDLILKLAEAETDANAKMKEAESYRADDKKIAEYGMAMAQREGALAQVAYYRNQIEKATIRAPMDAEILKGELNDKIDAPVKPSDVLFELAERGNLKVELAVNERDIQEVSLGQTGRLATTSLPSEKFTFKVDRIVPIGESKEQANVFKVYGTLTNQSPSWLPGMAGEARIDIRHEPLGWIWTHRLVEFIRLKLWI